MVQRWESGRVQRPQPRYLLALEQIFSQPAANLGFADIQLGVDRKRALADAGLDSALPLPDPAAQYGELTGIWLSSYNYESSSRGQTHTSKHYVIVLQCGARLMIQALPASSSQVSMDMSVNGQVVTGTWTEEIQADGYYGALQMLLDATGRRMSGKWVGFSRDMTVNTGPWSLTLVDSAVDEAAVERQNRVAERRNGVINGDPTARAFRNGNTSGKQGFPDHATERLVGL